jgi:hypothetical protein
MMRLPLVLLMTACGLNTPLPAAELVIDDFSEGAQVSLGRDPAVFGYDPADYPHWIPVPVPGSGTVVDDVPGSVLGGSREIYYERISGSPFSPTVDAWYPGFVSFNSGWDGSVAIWSLAYGRTTPLQLDMTACGNDRLRITGLGQFETYLNGSGNDYTPMTVTLVSASGSGSVSRNLRGNTDQSEVGYDILLSEFSGVDLTAVDELELRFFYSTANAAVDYAITRITLPEACEPVPVDASELPAAFALGAAWPNPFNPSTTIGFSLAETGSATLAVYDLAGRQVATLVSGLVERGTHSVVFDAGALPSGVYFYSLEADGQLQTRKMLLVK